MEMLLDQESRIADADHGSIRLWLRLLTCTSLIEQRLRARLRAEYGTTLPRFDFLAQLERADAGLTMGELSQRMMVSGGNISGIASQLEREGLIHRAPVPENRRTHCVTLTEEGRRQFRDMAEEHERWVIEMLGDLNAGEVEQLMALLGKVKKALVSKREG